MQKQDWAAQECMARCRRRSREDALEDAVSGLLCKSARARLDGRGIRLGHVDVLGTLLGVFGRGERARNVSWRLYSPFFVLTLSRYSSFLVSYRLLVRRFKRLIMMNSEIKSYEDDSQSSLLPVPR